MDDTDSTDGMNSELELGPIVAAIWSRKWLIVLVTLVSLAAGALYAAWATPLYEASAKLVPPLPADLEGPLSVADLELAYGERERWLTRLSAFRRGLLQVEDPLTQEAAFASLAERGLAPGVQGPAVLERYLDDIRLFKPPERDERSRILAFSHADGDYALAVVEAVITQANLDASALFADELRFELDSLARMLQARVDHARQLRTLAGENGSAQGDSSHLDDLVAELEMRIATLRDYAERAYPPVQMLGVEGGIELSENPVQPRVLQVLVLAGLGGLVLGVVAAALAAARGKRAG